MGWFRRVYFAWDTINLEDVTPDINSISQLLHSDDRLLRLEGEIKLNYFLIQIQIGPSDYAASANRRAKEFWTDIFTIVLDILKENDYHSRYEAAWCITYAGYSLADIIPHSLIPSIVEKLTALWIERRTFDGRINWAIYACLIPGMQITDSPELRVAIDRSLQSPDGEERLTAVCLGILNHQLSGQQVRNHLREIPDYFRRTRFLRELGYVDEDGHILDEHGNIIPEDDEE